MDNLSNKENLTITQQFADIPRYLEPNQNLLAQPPFSWVRATIAPDFFTNESEGWSGFLHRAAVVYDPTSAMELNLNREVKKNINEKYKNIAATVFNRVLLMLKRYPYWNEYLLEYWGGNRRGSINCAFDRVGNQRSLGTKPTKNRTYAAYAFDRLKIDAAKKWAGIEMVLPSEYSKPEEVLAAMPSGKNDTNKFYRLVRSGGLK